MSRELRLRISMTHNIQGFHMLKDILAQLELAKIGSEVLDKAVLTAIDPSYASAVIDPITTSVDRALAFTAVHLPYRIADVLHEARSMVGRAYSLHVTGWHEDDNGPFSEALALAIVTAAVKKIDDTL